MSRKPLRSVAPPKQARSQETLRRLLEAAEALIETKGFGEMSIADVAKAAQSSVGGFYRRFRDKDELLLALHERFTRDLEARMDLLEAEVVQAPTLAQMVRPCVQEMVRVFHDRRALFAAFTSRFAENPEMLRRGLGLRTAVLRRFGQLVLTYRDEIGHPEPDLAVDLAAQMMFALMDQLVVWGSLRAGGEALDQARIAAELERSFLAYLMVGAESAGSGVHRAPALAKDATERGD